MKVCSKKTCIHKGKLQPFSNFYESKKSKSGYRSRCINCKKEEGKEHRQSDKGKKSLKKWKEKNPSYWNDYWKNNTEKITETQKERYYKDLEVSRRKGRERYQAKKLFNKNKTNDK